MQAKILVAEDDPVTSAYIARGLQEAGYAVQVASDGPEALHLAAENSPDVIVLDRMLPGLDGLAVLRALRADGNDVSVIVLSALGTLEDRVKGLRDGSDDYLVKPFAFAELQARIDALLRRSVHYENLPTRLNCADLEIDLLSRHVSRAGKSIELQPREYQILEYLVRHVDQLVTRTMLLENVWGFHFDPNTNVIDVHISRLRHKIDKGFSRPLIHTIRNAGYMLSADK